MGTRSLTIFKDANEEDQAEFAVLYCQFDGYPSGHGADILECLKGKVVVNGFENDNQVNGAGDMAVQLIAFLKQKHARKFDGTLGEYVPKPVNTPGGLRLMAAGSRDAGEEYLYTITCPKHPHDWTAEWKGSLLLTVEEADDEVLFEGLLDDFDPAAAERSRR